MCLLGGSWRSRSAARSPQVPSALASASVVQTLRAHIPKPCLRPAALLTRGFRPASGSLDCRGNPSTPHPHIVICDWGVEPGARCGANRGIVRSGAEADGDGHLCSPSQKKKEDCGPQCRRRCVKKREKGSRLPEGGRKRGETRRSRRTGGAEPQGLVRHRGPQSSMPSRDRESIHREVTSAGGFRVSGLSGESGCRIIKTKGASSKLPSSA